MGRRAANHPIPVPVLGEPTLLGTRVWRTMANGTSTMAALSIAHHCNVGVQTSPEIKNQRLEQDVKCINKVKEKTIIQTNSYNSNSPGLKMDSRKDITKSIIIKQKSLETKMKKGVTFEGLEKDLYKNIKNEKLSNNELFQTSPTLRGVTNCMKKSKRSCFFTNGSVVDSEVMGGISSDITEEEDSSMRKKKSIPSCSPPHRPPVTKCGTCGGKQYSAPPGIYNQTMKITPAYSLGLQLRSSTPFYPEKDRQIESHTEHSVTQSDRIPMSPNLHSYLSMNTNKEWPLSLLSTQQSEVSNLTNHHAVKRESSAGTNINQSSRSSALNTQSLSVNAKEERGSIKVVNTLLNTHKASCRPPEPGNPPLIGISSQIEKHAATQETNGRVLHAGTHIKPMLRDNPKEIQLNKKNQVADFLNTVSKANTCIYSQSNFKHQTSKQSSGNEAVISATASNIHTNSVQILNESNVDKHTTPLFSNISSIKPSKTQICSDKDPKSSSSDSHSHFVLVAHAQKLSGLPTEESRALMHTNTLLPAENHKQDSSTSMQSTSTSLQAISGLKDSPTYANLDSNIQKDNHLDSHNPNMSIHHKATLAKQTIHHQNLSNTPISTQTEVEVYSHTKERSQTIPGVKPSSHSLCVHSKLQRQQTKPAVFRHSVLNQLNNNSLESSLPAIASIRALPQTKLHRGTELKQWSDSESNMQESRKAAEPKLKMTNASQRLIQPPNKPPPSVNPACQPSKPSSAHPQAPAFKYRMEENDNSGFDFAFNQNRPNCEHAKDLVQSTESLRKANTETDCLSKEARSIPNDHCSRKHDHPDSALRLLPPSPFFDSRRDLHKLETVEASLKSNKDRVTTLLNIIQDLEMSHAISKGRRCFQTGQDLTDCSTCQKTACAVYSVEYDFRQQERRFKELLQNMCPHITERREECEESLSLLTSLIQNHKLHQLKANLMAQSRPENQTQIQTQHPLAQQPTTPQLQTTSQTNTMPLIQSQAQIRLQSQSLSSSQTEIMSQILPPFPLMSQTQPQNQSQALNQSLLKAKVKRKKLCRKLFGWLPHRVHLK